MYALNNEKILQIMEEREMSIKTLSDRSGLSERTLYNAINLGKNIYLDTAGMIADGLGVPLSELLSNKKDKKQKSRKKIAAFALSAVFGISGYMATSLSYAANVGQIEPMKINAAYNDFGKTKLSWKSIPFSEYDLYVFHNGKSDFLGRLKQNSWSGYLQPGNYTFKIFPTAVDKKEKAYPGKKTIHISKKAKNLLLTESEQTIGIKGKTAKIADSFRITLCGNTFTTSEKELKIEDLAKHTTHTSFKVSVNAVKKEKNKNRLSHKATISVIVEPENQYSSMQVYSKIGYDPDKAIGYARKYAFSYNSDYADFNPEGGDCCNFVSQCLSAGGLEENEGWHYAPQHTASWTCCEDLYDFLKTDHSVAEPTSYREIEKGDVIMKKDFSHVVICSDSARGIPLICAHNSNHMDLPLYGSLSEWYVIKMSSPSISQLSRWH